MTVARPDHPAEASDRVAAIRYIVLRKLAPGIRHALMGHLQAVRWTTEAAARGLRAGTGVAKAQENVDSALRESIAAITSSDAIVQWLRPTEDRSIDARDGIAASVKLASADWFLRGIEVRVDPVDGHFDVSQRLLQEMTVAVLLVLADLHQQNADIHVHAEVVGDLLEVALTAAASDRESSFPMSSGDRRLNWADVELLAETNSVYCACDANSARLRFDRFMARDA